MLTSFEDIPKKSFRGQDLPTLNQSMFLKACKLFFAWNARRTFTSFM